MKKQILNNKSIVKISAMAVLVLAIFFLCGKVLAATNVTPSKIIVYMEKKGEIYEVVSMNMAESEYIYIDDYRIFKEKGLYNGRVISFGGKTLGYFGIDQMVPVLCTDSIGPDGEFVGGCKEVENAPVHVEAPYFPNGQYIEIYRPNGEFVTKVDLTGLAVCDENGVCKAGENFGNCPSDCREPANETKTGPVIDNKTDEERFSLLWIVILLVVILVGIGGGIYFFKNKEKNKRID